MYNPKGVIFKSHSLMKNVSSCFTYIIRVTEILIIKKSILSKISSIPGYPVFIHTIETRVINLLKIARLIQELFPHFL